MHKEHYDYVQYVLQPQAEGKVLECLIHEEGHLDQEFWLWRTKFGLFPIPYSSALASFEKLSNSISITNGNILILSGIWKDKTLTFHRFIDGTGAFIFLDPFLQDRSIRIILFLSHYPPPLLSMHCRVRLR